MKKNLPVFCHKNKKKFKIHKEVFGQSVNSWSPMFPGTRSLPIHCIIEQTSGRPGFDSSTDERTPHVRTELDSYAILPAATPLAECVQSALTKLGYNTSDVIGAAGK